MPRTLDDAAKERLGRNLAEARTAHKWTQGDAAQRAGVRRDRLNRWEKGRETPGTEGLLLLALAYDCSVDRLLSGVDEGYDEIIERRLPLDAARHYKAKTDAFIRRTTAAMQLAVDASVLAPTPTTTIDETERVRGRSSRVRARRARGT